MSSLKESYTTSEWASREAYYVEEVGKLSIPVDPTPKEIVNLESMIDSLLSEALLDQAYIRRRYDKAHQDMKLGQTELHFQVKSDPAYEKSRLTTDDIKSLVITELKSQPLAGYSLDIFTIVNAINYRSTFIGEIVRILTEKKSSLMIVSSMMKIEAKV